MCFEKSSFTAYNKQVGDTRLTFLAQLTHLYLDYFRINLKEKLEWINNEIISGYAVFQGFILK